MTLDEMDQTVRHAIQMSQDRRDLWANLLNGFQSKYICEVGVWKGEFSEVLLSRVPEISKYTLVDPWRNLPDWNKPSNKSDAEFTEIYEEARARLSKFSERIHVLRETTKLASRSIEVGSLDFVYIDGDHTLRGIALDLHFMLPKVKSGGFIGGDDFTRSIWQHGTEFSPTEVFPYAIYFAECHGLRIYTLPFDQFLIANIPGEFEVVDYAGYAQLKPEQIYGQGSTS